MSTTEKVIVVIIWYVVLYTVAKTIIFEDRLDKLESVIFIEKPK